MTPFSVMWVVPVPCEFVVSARPRCVQGDTGGAYGYGDTYIAGPFDLG